MQILLYNRFSPVHCEVGAVAPRPRNTTCRSGTPDWRKGNATKRCCADGAREPAEKEYVERRYTPTFAEEGQEANARIHSGAQTCADTPIGPSPPCPAPCPPSPCIGAGERRKRSREVYWCTGLSLYISADVQGLNGPKQCFHWCTAVSPLRRTVGAMLCRRCCLPSPATLFGARVNPSMRANDLRM